MICASDKVDLAVRVYKPSTSTGSPTAALIFYHGGGAHSGAGYHLVARGLADTCNAVVYTPDLRGHGASGGARGDAPSPEQVFEDINAMIDVIKKCHIGIPLFLGGHSSGGGLVVNYATWAKRKESDLAGYILLSPQLGYLAKVDRPRDSSKPAFAKVNIAAFIVNGITGFLGHNHAVQFQYPPEVLENDSGMVKSNTVNMANAITPTSPNIQFNEIKLPLGLWIGEDDELFLADKVAAYTMGKSNMTGSVLPGESHLGILVGAHKAIGPWLNEQVTKKV